ncbi:hypothetical protein [Microseira wollei]|uniref:Uncharacterized protein n=1 Tax=Microseira wollei NIES-4236 TaxID=2530354 RepID=A0AAV3XRB8_9CYAN|nr:hypothetical protein [Microseira wollei]GET42252.1 hypothetical protein MiSe_70660 [Microseira wollei NIES-4236]
MLAELLEVVKVLSEVIDRSQQAGEENRERIAQYLENIEECLRESVKQLQKGQVPNSKWSELQTYAQQLPGIIGQDIGQQTANQLSSMLSNIARNLPTNNDISSIENAAGILRGFANTIRVNRPPNTPISTGDQPTGKTRRKFLTYTAFGGTGLAGGYLFHKIIHPTTPTPPPTDDEFPPISW